ncbi:uncharacterized protein LOC143565738 [Bidens hawaiensis]|uniref:uncharacterized protein LOC143565738 n=1 Tax=Bidens hawaiensis TaxID=980011 RepID=UPI004049A563
MPKYAKFLKDLPLNTKKMKGLSTIWLNEGCSGVVQNKLPEKLADPVHFTIPCLFGSSTESYALADLGASINLMPHSLYKKLDHDEPVPTRMSLSLANRSVKYPWGIVENVLVKVDKFVFPVDFVILDMEADDQVPLILRRPFLRTAKALIDVFDGKITLRVGEENVTFDVIKSMRNSNLLNQEDEVDVPPEHDLSILVSTPLEYPEVFTVADSAEGPKERPSIEAPPSLELKELPPHLEYAFLDGDANIPVIISSQLMDDEKSRLVDVLKAHKQAIAWKLMDIQGIRPIFCMHRILMEDEYTPIIQPQRRLNPNMLEVVKKEVIKLLEAGLIYPISDSSWVSPVQVVPKKGGMTVVTNKRKELIPTRTVTGWRNYTTTEKDLIAVVFTFDKFRSYLVLSKTIVYTDHAALQYLFAKKDAKPRLIRWILLLSEFDIEIRDKKGVENVAADQLSHLEDLKRDEIREDAIKDKFPHESLMMVRVIFEREPGLYVSAEEEGLPWFSDIANYLAE